MSERVISTGRVSSARALLELITQRDLTREQLGASFSRISVVPLAEALDTADACGWLFEEAGLPLRVSERGKSAALVPDGSALLRLAILDYAISERPAWLGLVARGRAESINLLPAPVQQCLIEGDVAAGLSDDIVGWWDSLAALGRSSLDNRRMEIGREGERLSYRYEWNRVRRAPLWQAVESNLAGYDILSVESEDDLRLFAIEVKASARRPSSASFHVTRHEWDTLVSLELCGFHLWSLYGDSASLAVVNVDEVAPHIPVDLGQGRWETAEIQFSAFESLFSLVDPTGWPAIAH